MTRDSQLKFETGHILACTYSWGMFEKWATVLFHFHIIPKSQSQGKYGPRSPRTIYESRCKGTAETPLVNSEVLLLYLQLHFHYLPYNSSLLCNTDIDVRVSND